MAQISPQVDGFGLSSMPGTTLRADKIVETAIALSLRISERFPRSGLYGASRELVHLSEKAQETASIIARPIYALRILVGLLILAILVFVASLFGAASERTDHFAKADIIDLVAALEAGTNELVLVGLLIAFLISLENRIKRSRAIAAIHELRSVAHVIDMHQLTKDPGYYRGDTRSTESSPNRNLTLPELSRYLDYCSELLSITSKIAALYIQKFSDGVVLEAVSDVETLCAGLGQKIWQKLDIAESISERKST
jgi:hypothetical protein